MVFFDNCSLFIFLSFFIGHRHLIFKHDHRSTCTLRISFFYVGEDKTRDLKTVITNFWNFANHFFFRIIWHRNVMTNWELTFQSFSFKLYQHLKQYSNWRFGKFQGDMTSFELGRSANKFATKKHEQFDIKMSWRLGNSYSNLFPSNFTIICNNIRTEDLVSFTVMWCVFKSAELLTNSLQNEHTQQ